MTQEFKMEGVDVTLVCDWNPGDKDTEAGDTCTECWGMGRVIDTEGSLMRAAAKQYDTKECPRCGGDGVEPERPPNILDPAYWGASGKPALDDVKESTLEIAEDRPPDMTVYAQILNRSLVYTIEESFRLFLIRLVTRCALKPAWELIDQLNALTNRTTANVECGLESLWRKVHARQEGDR